jgi:hypothetical protein
VASTSDAPTNQQAAMASVLLVPIAFATGPATASPSGLKSSEPNQSYEETRDIASSGI